MDFDRKAFQEQAKHNDMLVVFVKKDKTFRELKCTLKPDVVNPTLKGGERTSDPRDVTCVYDIENKGWRSFRNSSVIRVGKL